MDEIYLFRGNKTLALVEKIVPGESEIAVANNELRRVHGLYISIVRTVTADDLALQAEAVYQPEPEAVAAPLYDEDNAQTSGLRLISDRVFPASSSEYAAYLSSELLAEVTPAVFGYTSEVPVAVWNETEEMFLAGYTFADVETRSDGVRIIDETKAAAKYIDALNQAEQRHGFKAGLAAPRPG